MWQQIVVGIVVGLFAWKVIALVGQSILTVLMRKSRKVAWLIAHDKMREEEFRRRVEAATQSPTITASSARYRY